MSFYGESSRGSIARSKFSLNLPGILPAKVCVYACDLKERNTNKGSQVLLTQLKIATYEKIRFYGACFGGNSLCRMQF